MSTDYLKLGELIKLKLQYVDLKHPEEDIAPGACIPEISFEMFSEFGKRYWHEVLDAKVDSLNERVLQISGISKEMFISFRDMLRGETESELYEKCIVDRDTLVADVNEQPETLYKKDFAMLTAVYENVAKVPKEDRVTAYFSEYGEYFFRQKKPSGEIKEATNKALKCLDMNVSEFIESAKHMTNQSIRLKMREGLMKDEIEVGTSVVFVTPKPEVAPDVFEIISGQIISIDEENKQCYIEHEAFSKAYIPFRYILAKHNEEVDYVAFGYRNCEMLLGANVNDVQTLLAEAMTRYYEHENEVEEEPQMDMEV